MAYGEDARQLSIPRQRARKIPSLHVAPRALARNSSALRSGLDFTCHMTTEEAGNGSNLMCAGAIEWQRAHECTGPLQRMFEAMDASEAGIAARSGIAWNPLRRARGYRKRKSRYTAPGRFCEVTETLGV
jgi:hypothetical protein